MHDAIVIDQLELFAQIGVPDEERAQPQRLTATIRLEPQRNFWALEDRIKNAVDYAEVCVFVKQLVMEKPRHLLETLADEIATKLLAHFPLAAVTIELRKFILPDASFVAAMVERRSPEAQVGGEMRYPRE